MASMRCGRSVLVLLVCNRQRRSYEKIPRQLFEAALNGNRPLPLPVSVGKSMSMSSLQCALLQEPTF